MLNALLETFSCVYSEIMLNALLETFSCVYSEIMSNALLEAFSCTYPEIIFILISFSQKIIKGDVGKKGDRKIVQKCCGGAVSLINKGGGYYHIIN